MPMPSPTAGANGGCRSRWATTARDRTLARYPDEAFDVLFTVSVVDHVADPDPLLAEMARVAKVLLLLEPWLKREGKVSREKIPQTSPYSYSWNLPKRLVPLHVETEPYPLTDWGLGPFYRLHTVRK
jgi:hypothetical protein